jgi:hypothetical protein
VELYILVLGRALHVREKEDPFTKLYWGSNESHAWGDLVREIGKDLYKRGKVETAEAVSVESLGMALASVAIPTERISLLTLHM